MRTPTLILSPLAEQDLRSIWLYAANENRFAADRLILKIRNACMRLAETPGMGRRRDELLSDLYSFPVGNYLVFYETTSSGIQVVRVIHGSRDLRSHFAPRT